MKIAIIGAGAIGGYVGVKLALAGEDLTFIVRGANLRAEATVDFSGFDTGSGGGLSLSQILPSIHMGVLVNFEISFSPGVPIGIANDSA